MEAKDHIKNRTRMKKVFYFFALLTVITFVYVIVVIENKEKRDCKNEQTSLTYDFSYAELAIKYLETGNPEYLLEISNLDATDHLYNHALQSLLPGGSVGSKLELITHFLSPIEKQRELLPIFKKRLIFAKESLAKSGIAEKITLQFLPADFSFSGSLFFTFGYYHTANGKNNNINLADTIYFKMNDISSMIYFAIHELHHVGFITLKGGYMPSIDITTYKEMLHKIEYGTHLEGMAVYAPLGLIEQENAMNSDMIYMALRDIQLLKELEAEYFDIYYHFKNEPDNLITEEDWHKFRLLTDIKGLWYIVGTQMAKTIDENLGREKLINLISEPSENFIATYLELIKQ